MEKQLTRDDILNAKEVYRYMDTVYVELKEDEVYGLVENGNYWFKKDNFYDYLESSEMMSYFSPITKAEVVSMLGKYL